MDVLVIILKVFIVVISILSMALVLMATIPFEYLVKFEVNNVLEGKVEISWIFGGVKWSIDRKNEGSKIKLIIAGLKVYEGNLTKKKRLQKIKEKARQHIGRLIKKDNKRLIVNGVEYFQNIVTVVKPQKVAIKGVYGCEDPALTGWIWGVINIFKWIIPKNNIYIEPNFNEQVINLVGEVKGVIIGYKIGDVIIKIVRKIKNRK